jgi:hypothetical protein
MQDGLNLSIVLNATTLLSVLGLAVKVYLSKQPQRIEQPLEVRAAAITTPKAQCDERHRIIDDQVSNVYCRLARLEREVAAHDATMAALRDRLDAMDAKLDILLARQ